MNRSRLIIALVVALLAASCRNEPLPEPNDAPPAAPASVELTVAVIGNETLASGIRLQQGEWNAHSGGKLRVVEAEYAALRDGTAAEADLFVFSPRRLGELVEHDLLRPLRTSVLENKSVDLADVFPLVRQCEMTYGGKTYGLPLYGQTPLLCVADDTERVEVLQRLTASWSGYVEACQALQVDGGHAVLEPTAEPWLAIMLIVRAGAYSEMDDRRALLFNAESMAPRLLEPPVIRGLSEMRQCYEGAAPAEEISPGDACARVLTGAAVASIGLPPGSGDVDEHLAGVSDQPRRRATRWLEPPPPTESYSVTLGEWRDARGDAPAMLGVGGAMLAVTTSTRNTAAAFRLAAWLAEPQRAGQCARRSAGAMPCRASHAASSPAWFGDRLTGDEKEQVAAAVESLLSREAHVQIPRIPAIDEYLRALNDAAGRAISGEASVEDALREASDAWERITERLSRERQLAAYQRHLQ